MTDYEKELGESFDWESLKRDCVENAVETLRDFTLDELALHDLTDGESIIGRAYIGSVFNLTPSGKYYMPFACSNVEPCPECGGDGHARERPMCPDWSVECVKDYSLDCANCLFGENSMPGDKVITEPCQYCNGQGKRSISELAELRKETYQECLLHFTKEHTIVFGENRPNAHYIHCLSCKGTGKQFVTCPTCNGMGSAEAYQDSLWQEALDKVCESHDMWNESGEGDPCDVFVARWVSFDEIVRHLLKYHVDVVTAWLKSNGTIRNVKEGLRAIRAAMNKIEQLEQGE